MWDEEEIDEPNIIYYWIWRKFRMLDVPISRGWDYIYDTMESMGEELNE